MRRLLDRALATGAIWGPAGFIASWVVGGLRLSDYSPVRDAISRLAAEGAPTAPVLNAGLIAYGVGVTAAAWPLRTLIGRKAAAALATNAMLTFGVLATPLDQSPEIDRLHAVFAGSAYAALAAAGLLAAVHLRDGGRHVESRVALVVGTVTAASLLAVTVDPVSGLFQRIGLTTSDVAMAAAASWYLQGGPSSPAEARSR